jgi:hypothetical protein
MSLRDSFKSFERSVLRPALGIFKGGARRRREMSQLHERLDGMERRIVELEGTVQESLGLALADIDRRRDPSPPSA